MGVLGIFSKISKKNVDNVISSSISGIDKLFFTNEEKAEFNKTMADAVAEHAKASLGENSIRAITRRFIAFAIVLPNQILLLATGVMYWFSEEYAAFLFQLAKEQATAFMMVLVFYFGGYYASKFIGSKKKTKKNKKVAKEPKP